VPSVAATATPPTMASNEPAEVSSKEAPITPAPPVAVTQGLPAAEEAASVQSSSEVTPPRRD